MNKAREILNHIGLGVIKTEDDQADSRTLNYVSDNKTNDTDKLKLHRDFLKSVEAEENARLTLIENKTTQLVAQTGVIFALMSLFIPLVIDKIDGVYMKLLVLLPLSLSFLFYLLTIHNAAKNFNVKVFAYSKSSITNVIKLKDSTVNEFLAEEINDLLYSAKRNSKINDSKATNLIYSYNCFKIANFSTAALGILLCASLIFIKPPKEPVKIENPIKIENYTPPANQSPANP